MASRSKNILVISAGLTILAVFSAFVLTRPAPSVNVPAAVNADSSAASALPALPILAPVAAPSGPPAPPPAKADAAAPSGPSPEILPPLADPAGRLTKKGFGLWVSPGHSPVSPERFTGYHTGLDFETFPAEQDIDVEVSAVCAGPLLLKKRASGYGGVAVQACRLGGRDVTVVYGHLALASIAAKAGDELAAGQAIGRLGRGFSAETDGERKHLHLSIHLGKTLDIKGYVQDQAALAGWLDPAVLGGWR